MDSLRAAGWKFPERPDAGNGKRDDHGGQSDESSSAPASEKPKTLADPSAEAGAKTKEKPETGDTEGSSQPPEEHGRDKTSPAQSGNSGAEEPGQAKPEDPRQDEGEREDDDRGSGVGQPEIGETGGQDDRDDRPPQDNTDASSTGDKIDSDDSKNLDPPSPSSSEQRPEPEGGKWVDEKPPAEALDKVPDKWGDGSPNKKGVGRRWTDPENRGNGIRIDEGDPNNPQPAQQVDHVVVRVNGKVVGRNGQPLEGSIKENWDQAHVPLSEWLKWDSWKSP
ncbi:hypothetical protein [Actinomadura darangshiensis]|uniref:hypothetical protein n=1 Tax=Actinomadura darangshiensis TaxID=705336 RepID=UPI001A9FC415|nr:hypothetical protein [Actinomadura darangshiensis]